MFLQVIDRLESDFDPQVSHKVLSLLASAKEGLSERELQDLLARLLPNHDGKRRDGEMQVVLRQVRSYLMRKGPLLDFYHRSFWKAVRVKYLATMAARVDAHGDLADFFEARDTLRKADELMFHLIGAGDGLRAARYYSSGLPAVELTGATEAIAGHLLSRRSPEAPGPVDFVTSWLADRRLPQTAKLVMCHTFLGQLQNALVAYGANTGTRLRLFQAVHCTMPELRKFGPMATHSELCGSYMSVGDALLDRGDVRGSREAYGDALTLAVQQARLALSYNLQREVAVIHQRLGDAHHAAGNLKKAQNALEHAQSMFQSLHHGSFGVNSPNAAWSNNEWAGCHSRVGSIMFLRGDVPRALQHFRAALSVAEDLLSLAEGNVVAPSINDAGSYNIMVSKGRIGDALLSQQVMGAAGEAYGLSIRIALDLYDQSPWNATRRRDLAIAHVRSWKLSRTQGDVATALKSFNEAAKLLVQLITEDIASAVPRRALASVYTEMALCERQDGKLENEGEGLCKAAAVLREMEHKGMATSIHLLLADVLAFSGETQQDAFRRRKPWWRFW